MTEITTTILDVNAPLTIERPTMGLRWNAGTGLLEQAWEIVTAHTIAVVWRPVPTAQEVNRG